MKKVYFLQTCDTCRRILKEVNTDGFERQEIKANNVSVSQLDEMHQLSGSYEALFNKRAKLYKAMDLKNQILSETDYKQYILDEYTFLKRPVFILNNEIFIGNSKKVVQALKEKIG
ncbi:MULTISPECIES: arsenate reductase family protein [unclassified Polaribacter]|jgi:arsenate reductase|uniref:arsenate reductase family protein n=1 Tax=unclassified Polaribacter TaxID=196858 RepID=UPI00052D0C76|nr:MULTISPECIES: ArsC/Spx/MgsR family protein [unclassified Polaribacter]KGL59270.1 arsenate reductase [Polaribacter sp. Hel1_33_49]MDG1403755.1 ArsC/Spx/MgsR family protein [Polaribacter sp.]PKV63751.1 arsenate reductase [Polaribacter sp. Hel1_33_96]